MSAKSRNVGGVDYDALDRFKREIQKASSSCDHLATRTGFRLVPESVGESAAVFKDPRGGFTAIVEETLGTKNLVAKAMFLLTGKTIFLRWMMESMLSVSVNDLLTSGALPFDACLHLAVGEESFLAEPRVRKAIIDGWLDGCSKAQCAARGGDTPSLSGIINPGACLISGSVTGSIQKGKPLCQIGPRAGDAIIILTCDNMKENGYTSRRRWVRAQSAREIIAALPGKSRINLTDAAMEALQKLAGEMAVHLPVAYMEDVPGTGFSFGSELCRPGPIHTREFTELQAAEFPLHYAANCTGHGWRKAMRWEKPAFCYHFTAVPPLPPVLRFIQEREELSSRDMYATFNCGASMFLFLEKDICSSALNILNAGVPGCAMEGGVVEDADKKSVVIEPLDIEFKAEELAIR